MQLKANQFGIWEVRWSERTPEGAWRSRSFSTRTKDRGQAEIVMRGVLAAQPAPAGVTVGDVLREYLRSLGGKSATSALVVSKHLMPYFGGLLPGQLGPGLILQYGLDRRKSYPRLADSTLRRELLVLRAALNRGVRVKLIEAGENPHIDLPPDGPPRQRFLDEKQEAEFLQLALGWQNAGLPGRVLSRVGRFVAIALNTGARKGAIEGLTWDRVDSAAGLIDFRDPGARASRKRRVATPINSRLLPILARAYQERTDEYVIGAGSIRSAYDTFVAATPYPWATPHVMRHTFGTLLARAGVPIWDIAGLMGNTPEVAARNYLHHDPSYLRKSADARFSG